MDNTAWCNACEHAGLPTLRMHHLGSEMTKLIDAANKACIRSEGSPTLSYVKNDAQQESRKQFWGE